VFYPDSAAVFSESFIFDVVKTVFDLPVFAFAGKDLGYPELVTGLIGNKINYLVVCFAS